MSQASDENLSRYIVGIDLGTTNSAVAYVDSTDASWRVRDFPVPQLVAPGQVEKRDALPSFHYAPAAGEFPAESLKLPWLIETPGAIVGAFARDHGEAVPGRLISSAKSWLSHAGVDRTARLLPWHGAADVERLSPVEVSARHLAHLRAAWDFAFPEHPLAKQEIVLTAPASFDEVARELTVEAARKAGLHRLTLVEEPQAAFYAWIDAHGCDWESRVKPGQAILVCDIGGGTTDFTLIRVRPAAGGKVVFHRVAVGDHLILGGDNLDLALAKHVEAKLAAQGKLEPNQWGALLRSSRRAKETLLGPDAPDRFTLTLPGRGSKLIGGGMRVELTREEVETLLVEGFLPRVPLDAKPAARRSGFQEFGLPFAPDAAITRYLAAFLRTHLNDRRNGEEPVSARPDLVLFNGGFFESPVFRNRLSECLTSWFQTTAEPKWKPTVLTNARLDLAVARGAAYYGTVRRGRGVRIAGGLAHSYYIGVDADYAGAALCLLPAGVEEGRTIDLNDRTYKLLIRQPVEFPLYYSSTRTTDRPGDVLAVEADQFSSLPPIRTALQSAAKSSQDSVEVTLHAKLTEIGTLDIWLAEVKGGRQWRLQFDIRAAARTDAAKHSATAEAEGVVDEASLARCRDLIRAAFRRSDDPADRPERLVKRLEETTGASRHDWPSSLLRGLWETLMEVEPARKISIEHEARWLNLNGFCLRPGYGYAVDDWRVGQMWKLHPAELTHHKNEMVRAEWWVLWRRLAGGLTFGQQVTLADPLLAAQRAFLRKGGVKIKWQARTFQFGPHESTEAWRALGSFELLRPTTKIELAEAALESLSRHKAPAVQEALWFALGRLGARSLVYGPLNAVVPAEQAESWLHRLMNRMDAQGNAKALFATVQLARRTGDRYRDLSDDARNSLLAWLERNAADSHLLRLVSEGAALDEADQRAVFGESLPRGLRIE